MFFKTFNYFRIYIPFIICTYMCGVEAVTTMTVVIDGYDDRFDHIFGCDKLDI